MYFNWFYGFAKSYMLGHHIYSKILDKCGRQTFKSVIVESELFIEYEFVPCVEIYVETQRKMMETSSENLTATHRSTPKYAMKFVALKHFVWESLLVEPFCGYIS